MAFDPEEDYWDDIFDLDCGTCGQLRGDCACMASADEEG